MKGRKEMEYEHLQMMRLKWYGFIDQINIAPTRLVM